MSASQIIIDALWSKICLPKQYQTPDGIDPSIFNVIGVNNNYLRVQTNGGTILQIQKESFRAAIDYLIRHSHISYDSRCRIGASIPNPGPLDAATRIPVQANATMVITYVLPILAATGVLMIDGNRPNAVWINL
ncbi:MAG: hypothetical protein EBR59_09550 [Methylococcaceae bacterium]|nr:hypothetical protein [Methylococcaceae bacterium]